MALNKQLQEIGLNKKEAKVYLATLELGETSIQRVAQKANLERTGVYDTIKSLQQKGLVSKTKNRKGKNLYFAEHPSKIKDRLEKQRSILDKAWPELLSITNLIDKKPKVRYYEGPNVLEDIYRDSLNYPKTEVLAWDSEKVFAPYQDQSFWYDFYMPTRIKKGILSRVIVKDSKEARKLRSEDPGTGRRTRIDHSDEYQLETELILYGESKVAIISGGEMMGLVIESKKIFQTLKHLFEIHWASLE